MKKDFRESLRDWEDALRRGEAPRVARELRGLNAAELPRESLLPFARLARRAGAVGLGLRLLGPLRSVDRNLWREEASPAETAEYAALLQACGAVDEALRLLNGVDPGFAPEALLFKAFCHFNQWDAGLAVSVLNGYLERDLAPYARRVGEVNLAAAYLSSEDFTQAAPLLERILVESARESQWRLHGNALEMRARLQLRGRDWNAARADLEEACRLVGAETSDQLYVRKWLAVTEALEHGRLSALEDFREEALRREYWEGARDADLYRLRVRADRELFDHLAFGTPHASFRARMKRELGGAATAATVATYLHGDPRGGILDLGSGEWNGRELLNPGKKIHQLLSALARDFYAPLKVGSLFGALFPGDHFDIESSPDRLHQTIRRARAFLASHELPLRIDFTNGFYALKVEPGLALRLRLDRPEIGSRAIELERLKTVTGAGAFTSSDARARLGLTPSGFQHLITWSLERQLVVREGRGRAVRYRFAG